MADGLEAGGATGAGTHQDSQLSTKLDLIFFKRSDIEEKNAKLERRMDEQHDSVMTRSGLPHSSPKKSHKCGKTCAQPSARKGKKHTKAYLSSDDSHDDTTGFTSHRDSSAHLSHLSKRDTSQVHPSMRFLKEDEETQWKVQRQLQRLQGQPRSASTSTGKPNVIVNCTLDCGYFDYLKS